MLLPSANISAAAIDLCFFFANNQYCVIFTDSNNYEKQYNVIIYHNNWPWRTFHHDLVQRGRGTRCPCPW